MLRHGSTVCTDVRRYGYDFATVTAVRLLRRFSDNHTFIRMLRHGSTVCTDVRRYGYDFATVTAVWLLGCFSDVIIIRRTYTGGPVGRLTFLCPSNFSKYLKYLTYHCKRICFSAGRTAIFRFNKTSIQGGPKVGLLLVGMHFTLKQQHFITLICICYSHICSILFM